MTQTSRRWRLPLLLAACFATVTPLRAQAGPRYEVVAMKGVMVAMRDGVKLEIGRAHV